KSSKKMKELEAVPPSPSVTAQLRDYWLTQVSAGKGQECPICKEGWLSVSPDNLSGACSYCGPILTAGVEPPLDLARVSLKGSALVLRRMLRIRQRATNEGWP